MSRYFVREWSHKEKKIARINIVAFIGLEWEVSVWTYSSTIYADRIILQRSKLDMYECMHTFPISGPWHNLSNVPECKLIIENIRQTQIERHSTKYLTIVLKCQGHQKQRKSKKLSHSRGV